MRFEIGAFEMQSVVRVEIRIQIKVGQRTDSDDRVRIRCTWIRYDRRDETVAEFAKIFRKNAETRG